LPDRQRDTHLAASFPGPEPSSVDANVYVWRYTLLVVHARKGFQDNLGKRTEMHIIILLLVKTKDKSVLAGITISRHENKSN